MAKFKPKILKAIRNPFRTVKSKNIEVINTKDIEGDLPTQEYNHVEESMKNQFKFDKISSDLGKKIICVYLLILFLAFIFKVFNVCDICYPPFLERFETLVLIITGFFFGTRVVSQFIAHKK
ncbi:MAG: hypothetical protein U9R34_07125 [Nanoarchaeota archaeon]|nr:hypothetical protein [Nanoarchaeota archaeon]